MPGCLGGTQDRSRTDYCVVDLNGTPAPAPTQAPQQLPTVGMSPMPTPAPTNAAVPTIRPSSMPVASPVAQPIKLVGYGGSPPTSVFPLQRCEGDCDVDSDVSCFWKGIVGLLC